MKNAVIFACVGIFCLGLPFGSSLAFVTAATAQNAQVVADEKEVVVMGVGANEEAAKRQAYRNAIQSVIGSMVISETIVENESLVKDKILSHSDGYVVKAAPVGSARSLEGGLVEVTMRVTVKSEQLKAKLKAENISIANMDGQSLFAQKKTTDEAKQDASAVITEKLKDIPASVLVATAFPQNAKQESKGSMVRLTLPVEVTVDKKKYKVFYNDFIQTVEKLGLKGKNDTIQGRRSNGVIEFDYREFSRVLGVKREETDLLAISNAVFRESATARWNVFKISPEMLKTIMDARKTFQMQVALLDKDGATIVQSTSSYTVPKNGSFWKIKGAENKYKIGRSIQYFFSVGGVVKDQYGNKHVVTFAPEVAHKTGYGNLDFMPESDILAADIVFDLTEEELASITSVKCTIESIPISKK